MDCTPQDQLPVKAVWREAVVGMRYICIPPHQFGRGKRADGTFFFLPYEMVQRSQADDRLNDLQSSLKGFNVASRPPRKRKGSWM